jgi:hypothetical protein
MAIAFQCIPVNAVWDLDVKGRCIDSSAIIFTGAAVGIFEDIVIILLPVPELIGLSLTLRKRLGVIFLFSLGSLYVHHSSF